MGWAALDRAFMARKVSLWGGLRARLLLETQDRGRKSELARYLGIARQAVNGWLTGAVAPNAEMTLRLLEWVEGEEAKQQKKRAARSAKRPAPTTRKRKSTINETPNPIRKKQ